MERSYSVMSLVWLPWHIRLLYKGWSNDATGVHMACVCGLCLCLVLHLFPDRISSEGSGRACVYDSQGSVSQTCVSCILLCPPSLWKRGTCFRTAEAPWQLQTVSHISTVDNSLRVNRCSVGDPGFFHHRCGTQRSHTLFVWLSKAPVSIAWVSFEKECWCEIKSLLICFEISLCVWFG